MFEKSPSVVIPASKLSWPAHVVGLTVIGWKVYYGDGTVKSSEDGMWSDLSEENVQVVTAYCDEKDSQGGPIRQLFLGQDFYWQWGCANCYPPTLVKILKGKWMTAEGWEAVRQKALHDYYL